METVDAYIFVYEASRPVAQIEISIRPMYDEAFPLDIAADVFYQDMATDKWHGFSDERARAILEDIRINDKDKWRQIVSAAKANFAPEFAEAV